MPTIPINPSSIQGAVNYVVPSVASTTDICKKPPEGDAYVPMQFTFKNNASWVVDLSSLTPTKTFSKVSTLYIDATGSTHDVNILFPDTGWQTRVAFGETATVNVFTANGKPLFYVLLDSGGATSATDIVNIIATNFFLPPASTSTFLRTVAYGYGQMFQLTPAFVQSTSIEAEAGNGNLIAGVNLINCTQFYITGINITSSIEGAPTNGSLVLFDGPLANNLILMKFRFVAPLTITSQQLIANLGGLNVVSSGTGGLYAQYADFSPNPTSGGMSFNIFGGILIS